MIFVEKGFLKRKFWWFWLIFFAIWANLHTGFLVGLAIYFGYSGINFLYVRAQLKKEDWGELIILWLSAFLGTFLTPYSIVAWKALILDILGQRTWFGIAEWQSVTIYYPVNLLFAISGVIFVYCVLKKFKKIFPPLVLTGAFIFAWAFLVVNSVFFWAIYFVYFTTRYLEFDFEKVKEIGVRIPLYFSMAAVFIAFFLAFLIQALESYDLGSRLKIDSYPTGAISFMESQNYTTGVFNDYAWGGFIDWYFPKMKVFIDGRMAGWRAGGNYTMSDYIDIMHGTCGPLSKYDVRYALLDTEFSEKCFSGFHAVYKDKISKVLARDK